MKLGVHKGRILCLLGFLLFVLLITKIHILSVTPDPDRSGILILSVTPDPDRSEARVRAEPGGSQGSATAMSAVGSSSGSWGVFRIPRAKLPHEKIPATCDTLVACILCEDTSSPTIDTSGSGSVQRSRNQVVARDFGRQIDQLVVLLKSIAISSKYSENDKGSSENRCTKVILISDTREHFDVVMNVIYDDQDWDEGFLKYLRFVHYPVSYPPGTGWMKTLFRPCATLRLFLPEILPENYRLLLFLDTDIIFLRDIRDLWQEFDKFTNETIAAMSPCLFHYGTSANTVPYYGSSGVNAGVMLMNLTRMREISWTDKLKKVTEMFASEIKLADQDILNIYFNVFPEQLVEFSCAWNMRPWNCHRGSECKEVGNISALHGNALSFTRQGSEPWFLAIFEHFKRVLLDSKFSITEHVQNIRTSLKNLSSSPAGHSSKCLKYPTMTQALLDRLHKLIPS